LFLIKSVFWKKNFKTNFLLKTQIITNWKRNIIIYKKKQHNLLSKRTAYFHITNLEEPDFFLLLFRKPLHQQINATQFKSFFKIIQQQSDKKENIKTPKRFHINSESNELYKNKKHLKFLYQTAILNDENDSFINFFLYMNYIQTNFFKKIKKNFLKYQYILFLNFT